MKSYFGQIEVKSGNFLKNIGFNNPNPQSAIDVSGTISSTLSPLALYSPNYGMTLTTENNQEMTLFSNGSINVTSFESDINVAADYLLNLNANSVGAGYGIRMHTNNGFVSIDNDAPVYKFDINGDIGNSYGHLNLKTTLDVPEGQDINLTAGDIQNNSSITKAGSINLTAGSNLNVDGYQGGDVSIYGGSSVSLAEDLGGNVNIYGGNGGKGGQVNIKAGSNGLYLSSAAADVNIAAGDSPDGIGGSVNITGGFGSSCGGNITLTAGEGYIDYDGNINMITRKGSVQIGDLDSYNYNTRLVIDTLSNIAYLQDSTNSLLFGICTDTPAYPLDVVGDTRIFGKLRFKCETDGTDFGYINSVLGGGAYTVGINVGTNHNLAMQAPISLPDGIAFASINDAGSANLDMEFRAKNFNLNSFGGGKGVGIQTQGTPLFTLDVNGSGNFSNGLTVSGRLNLKTQSNGANFTLGSNPVYIYSGASVATGTMPSLASTANQMYYVKSRGNTLTLTGAGSDKFFYTGGGPVTTLSVPSGQGFTIINDGIYWDVLSKLI